MSKEKTSHGIIFCICCCFSFNLFQQKLKFVQDLKFKFGCDVVKGLNKRLKRFKLFLPFQTLTRAQLGNIFRIL